MGLDIWFRDDIANILRAANEANLSAITAGEEASIAGGTGGAASELRSAYRRGFVSALVTLSQALGLPIAGMDNELVVATSDWRQESAYRSPEPPMRLPGGRRCAE